MTTAGAARTPAADATRTEAVPPDSPPSLPNRHPEIYTVMAGTEHTQSTTAAWSITWEQRTYKPAPIMPTNNATYE